MFTTVVTTPTIQKSNIFNWYSSIFVFFLIFVLFLIMFRISHIWVCYDICKLLENYHYEGGHSETITSFLLASSKNKFVKCFSYWAFMTLKHFTFVYFWFSLTYITSKFEYLLKYFLKSNKNRIDEGVSA